MKTNLLFTFFIFLSFATYSQVSFSDDFESYSPGDYIADSSEDWQVWPGGISGGETDALVTDAFAKGGSNSLELLGGGTQDIVLPFGGLYTEGTFTVSMDVLVPEGRESYFNIQGEEEAGNLWVLECYMRSTGIFQVNTGSAGNGEIVIQNSFPHGEWFNITLEVNLTENLWRIFVDGECLGSFVNLEEQNRVASLNLYPANGNSLTYIDNMKYNYSEDAEEVNITLDAGYAGGVDLDAGIGAPQATFYGINGSSQNLSIGVTNSSTDAIESFSLSLDAGGQLIEQEFTTTIPAGETAYVELSNPVVYDNTDQFATLLIGNVNGTDDQNTCNNSAPMLFRGFTPAKDKAVWVEEATGSWCVFCPRGDVYMNYLTKKYPKNFVGVAVHGGDPMDDFDWIGEFDNPNTVEDESTAFNTAFSGYPSAVVNRVLEVDPTALENPFVESVSGDAPLAVLSGGAQWDEVSRVLDVNIATEFTLVPLRSGTRLVVGLTEDGVTGPGDGTNDDTSDYDQVNAWANGGNGPMGGYENLPNPVPATQMVYNHVARHLFTDWAGLEDAYVDTDGNNENHVFSAEIPDFWDTDKMHLVAAFIQDDGEVLNAITMTLEEALANGFTSTIDPFLDQAISIAPNPTNGLANITMTFDEPTPVKMSIGNAMGHIIADYDYGTLVGKQVIQYETAALTPGVYYMRFGTGNVFATKKLIVTE